MSLLSLKSMFREKVFYGWVIVGVVFIISGIIGGVSFSFGVFFKSLESAFELGRTTTSAIISASMVFGGVFAVVGGWALDRFGPKAVAFLMALFTGLSLLLTSQVSAAWQLFVTYSLFLAMGSGPIYVATMPVVMRWFDRRRGLAVGIAGAGGGLGQMAMAPLATSLIASFDWRTAYLVLGVISWAVLLPTVWLLRAYPKDMGLLPDGVKDVEVNTPERAVGDISPPDLSFRQAFRTRSFWLFIFIFFLFAVCMMMILTHVVPHSTDIGFSEAQAALILSIIGATTIAGTLVMGAICDRLGRKRTTVISTLIMAGSVTWLAWSQSLTALYLFAIFFGFGSGGMMASLTAMIGDTFGLSRIGTILGMLDVGWWSGAAVGPVLGGFIYDASGSYFVAFLISAGAMFMGAVLLTLIRPEVEGHKAETTI